MQTVDYQRLNIQPQDRVLDLGCGEGRHSLFAHFFTNADTVVGIDLNIADLRKARQHIREFAPNRKASDCPLLVADGMQLPFVQHTFDVIVCAEVLEHIVDYHRVLAEIHRVLKPGGRLAISVPRQWPERICWRLSEAYHQVEGGHVRIFNQKQLRRDIEVKQFRFVARHWAHALHSPYWWLRCLMGTGAEQSRLVRGYHRLLVWDLMNKPWLTGFLETCLNPLMGKSLVMYFSKQQSSNNATIRINPHSNGERNP